MKDSSTNTAARKKVLDAVDGAINLLMRSGRDGLICADKLNAVRPTIATLTQQQGGEQEAGDGVTDDIVERACEAYLAEAKRQNFNPSEAWARSQQAKDWMRAALTAALRTKQPAASEGDGIRVERAEYFSPTEGGHFLRVVYRWPHNGKLLRHTQFVELHSKDQVEHLIVLLNTSKQAAGEAVGYANRNEFEMEGCAGFTCSKRPPLTEASFFTIPLYLHPPRHPADEVRSAVTDAMVDRACDAYDAVAFELANRTAIRAAMTAALAGTP